MTQRGWARHIREQARGNPIRIADRFLAHYRLPSVQTYAEVAAHFGVTGATVSHYVALVERLPTGFVEWLRGITEPEQMHGLTERRLRAITRLHDLEQQGLRLQALAGAWR